MADFTFRDATIVNELPEQKIGMAQPAPATPAKISMNGPKPPTPQSESVLNQRAAKYSYGLGEDSPGEDLILNSLRLAGGEEQARLSASRLENARNELLKSQMIRNYVNTIEGPASQEDIDLIQNMSTADLADPVTYFEKAYARRLINQAVTLDMDEQPDIAGVIVDDSDYTTAYREDPERTLNTLDAFETIKTNQELDLRRLEDGNARFEKLGLGSKIGNFGEMMLPFVSQYRLRNLMGQDGSGYLGRNITDSIQRLNFLPVGQRKAEADKIFEQLWQANPYDALHFAQAMLQYGSSDQFWDNFVSIADLPIFTGAAVGASLATKGVVGTSKAALAAGTKLANSLKGVVKATGGMVTNPLLAVEAAGQVAKSAGPAAVQIIKNKAAQAGNYMARSYNELMWQTPAISNPARWLGLEGNLGHMTREPATRLANMMERTRDKVLTAAFEDVLNVSRLGVDGEAPQAARDLITDTMNRIYGQGSDVVIDVDLLDPADFLGGAQFAAVKLGRKEAELFDTPEQAMNMAKDWYGLTVFDVKTQGGKYYIQVLKPVNETDDTIRRKLKIDTKGATPQTVVSMWLSSVRSKDYLVSPQLREATLRGTLGGQALIDVGRDMWKEIGRLKGTDYDDLRTFLNFQRDFEDIKTGERGMFSEGLVSFETDWVNKIGKMPTEQQTRAYFMARTLNDLEYQLHNVTMYRDLSRKGVEQWDFVPLATTKPSIEGILTKPEDIWKFKSNASIVVIDDNGITKPMYKNYMPTTPEAALKANPDNPPMSRSQLNELLATGNYRVVQITDVGNEQLKARFAQEMEDFSRVDFVVTPFARSAPLDYKRIPYNAGGHVAIEDGWMLRQAIVKKDKYAGSDITHYMGDKNAFHFMVEKDGREIEKRLNHIRQLWLKAEKGGANDIASRQEIIRLLKDGYLPMTVKAVGKMFRKSKGGKYANFDPREPFYLTRTNQSVEDAYKISDNRELYPNFESRLHSDLNVYEGGVALEWTGKRGGHTYTLERDGSVTSPTFNFKRAEYIDADIVLERAFRNAMKERYYGDVKHQSAERFLAEFGDILEMDADIAYSNPVKAMLESSFKLNADPYLKKAAENARRSIKEFLGVKSDWEKQVDYLRVKQLQKMYEKSGVKGAQKTLDRIDLLNEWSYGLIKDPVRFFKRIGFSANLGLLNPQQLLVQGLTSIHTTAVLGPKTGFSAMRAATVSHWLAHNMDHIKDGAKIAGWKAEEFKEATDAAMRLGWFRVGKEYAAVDDLVYGGLKQTRLGMIDDFMSVFFRTGESFTRRTAWYGAYAEWRAKNPTAKFTNAVASRILTRADDLSVNMTANSNAQFQKGLAGLPTQFWSYHARLLEQVWGGKLTGREKARMLTTYAALYGVPMSAAIPVGVWQVSNSWRESADKWGISDDIADNVVLKTIQDGLVNMATQLINDGEQIDFAARVGPSGLPVFEDLLDGDTEIVEALTGVGPSTAYRVFAPFTAMLADMITGERSFFNTTMEDWADLARTTSSGNAMYNGLTALAYGKIFSRNTEMTISDDVSTPEAIFKILTGANPTRFNDMFGRIENRKEIEAYQKERVGMAVKEMRRAHKLDPATDGATQFEYYKRATNILNSTYGLTPTDRRRALRDGFSGHETMLRRTDEYWMKQGSEQFNKVIQEMEGRSVRNNNGG